MSVTNIDWPQSSDKVKTILRHGLCSACHQPIILLCTRRLHWFDRQEHLTILHETILYPRILGLRSVPPEITGSIRDDFIEACATLDVSAKASATLSRRCLQSILSGQGYSHRNLAVQIDAVLAEENLKKVLPTALHEMIDAIRNVGNFGAHRITDKTTLQVIDVEPHEAEFCLDIIEGLFDHYYVKPALTEQRMTELNKKLTAAGKPPAKGATAQPVRTAPPQKPTR